MISVPWESTGVLCKTVPTSSSYEENFAAEHPPQKVFASAGAAYYFRAGRENVMPPFVVVVKSRGVPLDVVVTSRGISFSPTKYL